MLTFGHILQSGLTEHILTFFSHHLEAFVQKFHIIIIIIKLSDALDDFSSYKKLNNFPVEWFSNIIQIFCDIGLSNENTEPSTVSVSHLRDKTIFDKNFCSVKIFASKI